MWLDFIKFVDNLGNSYKDNLDNLRRDVPWYIVFWLMAACESPNETDPLSKGKGYTMSHAVKMRAAVSWGFGTVKKCGHMEWRQTKAGFEGNPSLSYDVSRYMVALQRKKVRNSLRKFRLFHLLILGAKWRGSD
jgi:hypothetical protein